jgi:hypothetical protein
MPTIPPVLSSTDEGIFYVEWEGIATSDTIVGYPLKNRYGLNAAAQITGTFDGATVKIQVSNDNSTYYDIKDIHGVAVSATDAALFDIGTSAGYIRPSITAGTGDSVTVRIVFRGPASNT